MLLRFANILLEMLPCHQAIDVDLLSGFLYLYGTLGVGSFSPWPHQQSLGYDC